MGLSADLTGICDVLSEHGGLPGLKRLVLHKLVLPHYNYKAIDYAHEANFQRIIDTLKTSCPALEYFELSLGPCSALSRLAPFPRRVLPLRHLSSLTNLQTLRIDSRLLLHLHHIDGSLAFHPERLPSGLRAIHLTALSNDTLALLLAHSADFPPNRLTHTISRMCQHAPLLDVVSLWIHKKAEGWQEKAASVAAEFSSIEIELRVICAD